MSLPKSPQKKRMKYVRAVDLGSPPSVSVEAIDWSKCILCKGAGGNRSDPLKCPANNPVSTQRYKGYGTLAQLLLEFQASNLLPLTIDLETLDDGKGLTASLAYHKAAWHVTCGLKYCRQALTRLKNQQPGDETGIRGHLCGPPCQSFGRHFRAHLSSVSARRGAARAADAGRPREGEWPAPSSAPAEGTAPTTTARKTIHYSQQHTADIVFSHSTSEGAHLFPVTRTRRKVAPVRALRTKISTLTNLTS